MKAKARKRWILIGVVAVLGVVSIFYFRSKRDKTTYREFVVTRGDIHLNISAMGVVQPKNKVDIKPPINGRVEEALVKEGKKVQRGEVLAWMSSTERAALLDAARARGPEELKKWENLYRATPILAPIAGTVIERNVESGQSFTTQDPVFVVSDRLIVKAQVDETDIAQIKVGQKAVISVDAYPEQSLQGRVEQVAFNSATTNNVTTYEVDVVLEKAPPFVRSGMTTNVSFGVESKEGILLISTEALRTRRGEAKVLRKDPSGGKPEEIEVTLGVSDGKFTEVVRGLAENEVTLVAERNESSGRSGGNNPFAPSRPQRGGGSGGRRN